MTKNIPHKPRKAACSLGQEKASDVQAGGDGTTTEQGNMISASDAARSARAWLKKNVELFRRLAR